MRGYEESRRHESDSFLREGGLALMRAGPCADHILLRRDGLVAGQIDDQGDGIQCKTDEVHRAQGEDHHDCQPDDHPPAGGAGSETPHGHDEADDADNQHQQRVDAHHRRGVVHRGIVRFQQTVMFQQIVGLAFEPAGEHEQCDGRHDHVVGGGDGHQHSFRLASQWCRRLHGVALRIHIGPFRGVASSDVRCAARER